MRFANPQMLWLLLVLPPALVVFFWWSWRKRQSLMTQFIQARLLPGLITGVSLARQQFRLTCLVLAVTCSIIALARPQWGFDWEEVKQRGLDIVVAIDTSKSMLAEDIAPNRLARAKLAALDLMQQAKSDRLGLVAFAGSAFLECPLTIDDTAFRQSVTALNVNTISQGGTALAEAINTALTAFKEGDNYKVLVLFTDGEDNDEGALDAAQSAAKAGLRIFTIGIGKAEGELIRIGDGKGNTDYVRDADGNVLKSHLNEALLQQIAGATEGGFYLPLRGAKTIDTLYEKGLAPLPKSEGKEKLVKRYHERYHWPLAAAILLLLGEMFFPERKREPRVARHRSSPKNPQGSEPRKGGTPNAVVTVSTAILALLLLPGVAFSSSSSALKDYHSNNFTNAQMEYERLAQADKTGDLRLTFNAGTAAYQATNYDAAIKHFTSALTARDVKLQQAAYFNLGNAQFRLGQSAKDLDGLQQSLETAIKSYQNAVALDKNDADAAFNLAFTTNAVEQIKQFKEALRRAKSDADTAVRRAEFHRALEIMLPLQKTIAAKQFEEFTKKLKDIDDIATPHQP